MRYNFLLTSQYNRWLPVNMLHRTNLSSTANLTYFLNKQKNNLLLYFLLDFSITLYTRLKFFPYIKNGQFFFTKSHVLFFDIISLSWFVFIIKSFFYIFSFFLVFFFIKNFFFWGYFYFFFFLTVEFYIHTFLMFFNNFFFFLIFIFFYIFLWYPIYFFFNLVFFVFINFKLIFFFLLVTVCYYFLLDICNAYTQQNTQSLNPVYISVEFFKVDKAVTLARIIFFFMFLLLISYAIFFCLFYIILNFFFYKHETILYQTTKFQYKATPQFLFCRFIVTLSYYFSSMHLILKRNLTFLFLNVFNFNSSNFRRNVFTLPTSSNLSSFDALSKFDILTNKFFDNRLLLSTYSILISLSSINPALSKNNFNNGLFSVCPSSAPSHVNLLLLNTRFRLFISADMFKHFNSFMNLKFISVSNLSYINKQLHMRNNLFSLSSLFSSNHYNVNFLKSVNFTFIKTNFYNFYDTESIRNNLLFDNIFIKKIDQQLAPLASNRTFNANSNNTNFCEDKKFFFFTNQRSVLYGYSVENLHRNFFFSKINFIGSNPLSKKMLTLYLTDL